MRRRVAEARASAADGAEPPLAPLIAEALDAPIDDPRVAALVDELDGFGPLAPWVRTPGVTDVLVDGAGAVWTDGDEGLVRRPGRLDPETAGALAVRLLHRAGRRLDAAVPLADARVGGVRVHAVLPPVSGGGTLLSLRIPAPAGLESVASTPANTLSLTGDSFKDFGLDPFAWAVSVAEADGSNVSAFLAHPDDALAMAQMVDAVDSRRPLLADPRAMMDRPVLVNRHVTPGTIWAVDRSRVFTVLRQNTTIAVSDGPFFTSDSVAIRATMRVGFGFPHPGSVLRIQLGAGA